jgi:hypothetical protein
VAECAETLLALAIGFAVAAVVASGYQLWAERPLSFRLMIVRERGRALAAVPMLVLAAPFIIMRNTIRGSRFERRRAGFVAVATVVAGLWSLMSGTLVGSAWIALMRLTD